MPANAQKVLTADRMSAAFEHSITWEEDIWRADPVDVEELHPKARAKFNTLIDAITAYDGRLPQARMLLFHGESGTGKTHLIRALRTNAHRQGKAYFGYAQMSPDVSNYADYFLKRLMNSLEKSYAPDSTIEGWQQQDGGEQKSNQPELAQTALARLTAHVMGHAESIAPDALRGLLEDEMSNAELARLVMQLADDVVVATDFASLDLDINIIRALLYLQRKNPRIDSRVRQYLRGGKLNELSQEAVAALDPNAGDGRAFEIIESIGRLMWSVDRAALVFCIDQVEDLRFFDDGFERFQRAVRDLIQIANRVPTSIIIISCLSDFYAQAREHLAQSYIDRIEKSGPVALNETRSGDDARLLIARRLAFETTSGGGGAGKDGEEALSASEAGGLFSPQFYDEFRGLPARRLLEQAQSRCAEVLAGAGDAAETADADAGSGSAADGSDGGFVSSLAAALGGAFSLGGNKADAGGAAPGRGGRGGSNGRNGHAIDYRDHWDRFILESEAETPSDDQDMMHALMGALNLAASEWRDAVDVTVSEVDINRDLPCIDVNVQHSSGHALEARVFLCNRPTQGGGLKRQLDKVLTAMDGHNCVMLRASDFPPNRKNQTAHAFRKFRDDGGRSIMVPLAEWERMMAVREFHARHRLDPGFGKWFEEARLLSNLVSVVQLLRLDLIAGHPLNAAEAHLDRNNPVQNEATGTGIATGANASLSVNANDAALQTAAAGSAAAPMAIATTGGTSSAIANGIAEPMSPGQPLSPAHPLSDGLAACADDADAAGDVSQLPLSLLLDQSGGGNGDSIFVGREIGGDGKPVTLNKDILKRHAAVLGGSGSGKTTLALSVIEQLLLRGIPVVLIDRKGDLCSYANPDVWRAQDGEFNERRGDREKLGDAIDVAVYTPGRSSGRPISITLLPNGISELPAHEQQLLAKLSAAAIGEMLHLKNSATHQKQSGTLSVALRILGSRSTAEVTLADLIYLLEDEDPELTDLTQRMDPSGKIRRDLVAQLDSLRYRNAALFEGGGEPLTMESLFGIGPFSRPGRTRLSVIYTGFLGDNENILFWVSQFLAEALRFCQRNPHDDLQAVVMFDEADLYIPANAKPATAEPLQSLLKRARSAGLGIMLATQSPGDLDYKSRDQITSWFIGRVREDTALRKLKAAFQSESGLDPAAVLPGQTVGQFHLVQENHVRSIKAQQSLILAEQVPFDRIEQLASETKGQDECQLGLFDR